MTKRIATTVAVLGAASIISGCAIEQPSAGCFVQDSSFALWQAKYIPKTEADAAKACGQLKGEELGVWKYSNPEASAADVAANRAARLAIRPRGLASLTRTSYKYKEVDPATGKEVEKSRTVDRVTQDKWDDATALSTTLPPEPDSEGYCKATGFAPAALTVETVTNHVTGATVAPAASVTYQFNDDVEVFSAPSAPGTQLRGSLTYTSGACTAEYEVWALWPSVGCVPGSTEPAESCGVGSGLNPDFDAVCDADLEACVPAKRPGSFKAQ
ncbi:hypothetical protein [Archangium sp.]|uniref:hypothetical protein n=1 Tax=Archangium sp. TaxID=1872627 RepID=UPI00286A6F71|nr:hypothetical protein [Archangium sp.]